MQRDAGIPRVWAGVVEALIILAVLTMDQGRRRGWWLARAPRAAGAEEGADVRG